MKQEPQEIAMPNRPSSAPSSVPKKRKGILKAGKSAKSSKKDDIKCSDDDVEYEIEEILNIRPSGKRINE